MAGDGSAPETVRRVNRWTVIEVAEMPKCRKAPDRVWRRKPDLVKAPKRCRRLMLCATNDSEDACWRG